MRKLLLLILFMFVPLAQADDSVYRVCSAKILKNLFDDRESVHERTNKIEAASSLEELLALADEFKGSVLALSFRSGRCQEGYDRIWRLNQLLNDAYAGQSLRLAGVADVDNPFARAIEAARDPLNRQFEQLDAILGSGERDDLETTGGSGGPDCYYEDMAEANDRGIAYRMFLDGAQAADDLSDLIAYSSEAVAWHGRAWSALPRCSLVYSYLIDWSRLLNSFAIGRVFELSGVPAADNPFLQDHFDHFEVGVGEAMDSFSRERLRVEKRPVVAQTTFGLAHCAVSDLESFSHMPVEFADLVEQGRAALSDEDKLQFIARQIEWRRQLWLHLPMCQEALELTWLMHQISTDYAAMHALSYLAQGDLDTPFQAQVEASHSNSLRLLELLDSYEQYHKGELALPSSPSETQFTCGDAMRELSFWDHSEGYSDVLRLALTMETLDDALQYSREYVDWRAGMFSRLPTCPEAIEVSWLEALTLTGNALFKVLEQAGLPANENPYAAEVDATASRMRILIRAVSSAEPVAKETVTLGKSRLPECAQSESLAIALPALKFEEMLEYPRETSIAEMLDYAATYLGWRAISFDQFPLCFEAHLSRLQFTQVVGDVIARRMLDIDGRLYSRNPFRELPNDRERFSQLTDTLYASRRADGPAPDERQVAACTGEEFAAVADMANGINAIAQSAATLDFRDDLPSFHATILSWRDDLMASLPQCAGAVELGWLMNTIHIDLAVLGSLIFVGADVEALPHADLIDENLARMAHQAQALGLEIQAAS
ncbi:MAG: hypothetical protein OXG49_17865 [Chloroflexi bacterium]|nr:hypothetical protein [Chloroflexota bacterium]